MISICSGWVGTHLERVSVPGVSWGLEGVGCKFPNLPSLEMRFALDLTKICVLITVLYFLPTNMSNSERDGFPESKKCEHYLSFLRALIIPFSWFPLFPRRSIPVLQHELGCHT